MNTDVQKLTTFITIQQIITGTTKNKQVYTKKKTGIQRKKQVYNEKGNRYIYRYKVLTTNQRSHAMTGQRQTATQ